MPDLDVRGFPGRKSEATFCGIPVSQIDFNLPNSTYKIGQVDMALGVEQHVVGLHVAVYDTLGMDVSQGTAQLGNPEANGILREGLPRNMESEIAAIHEIDHNVSSRESAEAETGTGRVSRTHMYSMSWKLYRRLHRNGWFKCSSMRRSRMMFRTLSARMTEGISANTGRRSWDEAYPPLSGYILTRR